MGAGEMDWMQRALTSPELRLAVIPSAFFLGILGAASSCCSPAILGVVAGYSASASGGSRQAARVAGLCFLLGTVVALAALGAMAGLVGQAMGTTLEFYGRMAAGVVAVFFGLAALRLLPFALPRLNLGRRSMPTAPLGAAVLGLAVGGASAACLTGCNPLITVPLGVAALRGDTLGGAGLLAAFALGYGLTLLAAAAGLQAVLARLKRVSQRTASVVNIAAGLLLIAAGLYLLATV